MDNTKAEIISDNCVRWIIHKPLAGAIMKSMDEYAKQQAIGFAEYLGEWGWELCPAGHSEAGKWVSLINIQYGFKTTEELYSLYLTQQK